MTEDVPYAPSLRQMAFVQRWSIARLTRRPNIAEHSFFVAVYADMVAERIGWYSDTDNNGNPTGLRRSSLLRRALIHDWDEIVTGDMPGPGKRAFVDGINHLDWVQKYLYKMIGNNFVEKEQNIHPGNNIKSILKVANLLDERFFLADEHAMGNKWVWRVMEHVDSRLKKAWFQLPAEKNILDREWIIVRDAIEGHMNPKPIIPGLD